MSYLAVKEIMKKLKIESVDLGGRSSANITQKPVKLFLVNMIICEA